MMAGRSTGISYEPCTLVYTLLNEETITFHDFSLIVRSLHSYMVDSIVPNPELLNVHIKLKYQASIANAQSKLGDLQNVIHVSKLSSYVKENEIPLLEQLRAKFNIGAATPDTRPVPKRRPRLQFAARPAPYKKTKAVPEMSQPHVYPSDSEEDGEQKL